MSSLKVGRLALGLVLIVAASGGAKAVEAAPEIGAASESGTTDPFTIGLMVEMTGNLGFLGQSSDKAIQVALDQINAEEGRPIEIVSCDTKSDPATTLSCYDRLVQRDGVDALLGPGLTPNAEAIADRTDRDQIPNYVLGGSYGQYDMFGHQYQFGAHAVTEDVLAATWRWAAKQGHETAFLISSADATGEACLRFLEDEQWAEDAALLEVIGRTEMDVSAQTAAPQMAEVAEEADLLVLCVAGGAAVVAATAYEQSGLQMPAVTMHSNGVPFVAEALAGKVRDGMLYVPSFCVLAAAHGELDDGFVCSERATAFVDAYASAFPDEQPDILGAAAYDGILQLAEAARATDGSPDAIVEWFESQEAWAGAAGLYSYSPERHRGLGTESVLMGVLESGRWVLADMLDVPST